MDEDIAAYKFKSQNSCFITKKTPVQSHLILASQNMVMRDKMDEFKVKLGVVRGTDVSSSGPTGITKSAVPCHAEICWV